MSMTFGEFEVSPASLRKLLTTPVAGRRYILLDSVRDFNFLNVSSTDSLGNTIPDMGLGVVDNGLFIYTTKAVPGSPTNNRPYPVKFFWIGSPAGTNDTTDVFSIFVADVNQEAFYPGVPASAWLLNPRLVLSVPQAQNDIWKGTSNWWDGNYPGGTTAPGSGVGATNTGTNTTYGTLAGGTSPVGNISGMNSLDGQFWPVYDYVDNSIILYFSVKTANLNTLSIYCYKITDSEIASPITSSEFTGGVYCAQFSSRTASSQRLLSSHRYSVLSPDPLVTAGKFAGMQTAVIAYCFGLADAAETSADHGAHLNFFGIQDIHGSPLNWNSVLYDIPAAYYGMGVDAAGLYNPDKLGNIVPVTDDEHAPACYAILYNATTDRDMRPSTGSTNVVINAMQIRVAYLEASTQPTAAFGGSVIEPSGLDELGHCRPQYTRLPDGLPKILYANFTFDQNLNIGYEYVEPHIIKPSSQKKLVIAHDGAENPLVFSSFGKRKARISLASKSGVSPNPRSLPSAIQIASLDSTVDFSSGIYGENFYDSETLVLCNPSTRYSVANETGAWSSFANFVLEDISPRLRFYLLGNGASPFWEIIELE